MAEAPRRIGHYEVLGTLGAGGMAEVFLGRHEQLGHAVAIKVLDARFDRDPSFRQRFVDEARIQANLRHPGILAVQDILAEAELTAIVMEYLEGAELSDYVKAREDGLPVPEFLFLATALADALAYAHDMGVVHRDIKPSNVFLARQGRQVVPKLMDFGIAKLLDASLRSQQTAAGAVLGTPQFMAPEQFEDASAVDARADIFAFGTLLYLLLARRLPFRGDGVSEIMRRVLLETPDPLSGLRGDLPTGLEALVFRCLEKKPSDRFQTMVEVLAALQELATRVAPRPLLAESLPVTRDRDGLRERFGLASTTGETLGRSARSPTATEPQGPPTQPARTGTSAEARPLSPPVHSPGPGSGGPRPHGRTWPWILGGLLLLAGAAAGLFLGPLRSPREAGDAGRDAVARPPDPSGAVTSTGVDGRGAVVRPPRGEWPDLPSAPPLALGSRLHSPPRGPLDRHLSALLALGWEDLEAGELEPGEPAALGITAGDLETWRRAFERTPEGRQLLPWLREARAPGGALRPDHLEALARTLADPGAALYVTFQARLRCRTRGLDLRAAGATTSSLMSEAGLDDESFEALKRDWGADPLLRAEIAARGLACVTGD